MTTIRRSDVGRDSMRALAEDYQHIMLRERDQCAQYKANMWMWATIAGASLILNGFLLYLLIVKP